MRTSPQTVWKWKSILLTHERGLCQDFHSHLCHEYKWQRAQGRVPGQSHSNIILNFLLRLQIFEEKGCLESYPLLRGVRSTERFTCEHWLFFGKGASKGTSPGMFPCTTQVQGLWYHHQQGDFITRHRKPVMACHEGLERARCLQSVHSQSSLLPADKVIHCSFISYTLQSAPELSQLGTDNPFFQYIFYYFLLTAWLENRCMVTLKTTLQETLKYTFTN